MTPRARSASAVPALDMDANGIMHARRSVQEEETKGQRHDLPHLGKTKHDRVHERCGTHIHYADSLSCCTCANIHGDKTHEDKT